MRTGSGTNAVPHPQDAARLLSFDVADNPRQKTISDALPSKARHAQVAALTRALSEDEEDIPYPASVPPACLLEHWLVAAAPVDDRDAVPLPVGAVGTSASQEVAGFSTPAADGWPGAPLSLGSAPIARAVRSVPATQAHAAQAEEKYAPPEYWVEAYVVSGQPAVVFACRLPAAAELEAEYSSRRRLAFRHEQPSPADALRPRVATKEPQDGLQERPPSRRSAGG